MHPVLSVLHSNGFVEISGTDPYASTLEVAIELAGDIGAVAPEAAEAISASGAGRKPLNTFGGNYGYGELPLHTDLAHWYRPPHYVLLRCVTGATSVATRIVSLRQVESCIAASIMRRALFSPRRKLDGKMFLLRMLTDELLRWDQLFLKPQNAAAHKASAILREIGSQLPCANVVLSRPGQVLLIDNWRSLHGRSSVPAVESNRQLDRVYLDISTHGNEDPS